MIIDSPYFIYYITIIFFIICSAFFSSVETAIVASRRMTIETYSNKGNRGARRSLQILDDMESAIGMVLIGNNIVNISATAFITYVATKAFLSNETELFVVVIIQTIFFLLFCEIIPKVLAKAKAENLLMFYSFPVMILLIIFRPLVYLSLMFNNFLKKRFKISERSITPVKSREDIYTFFLIGKNEGVIDDDKHSYVADILSFKYIQAEEVMTPLVDVISIEQNSSIKDTVAVIEKTKFSRIPLFDTTRENITGYVHYKDIIKNKTIQTLEDIKIPPVFTPSTKNIFKLYHEMYKNKTPILFVVNEYGDIIGLLTFEDIAEEIVGEIHTDDHPDEHLISRESDKKYLVSGRIDIEYFQEYFSLSIEKRNFETLAGFISYLTGEIPKKGDKVKYQDIEFIIEETGLRTAEKIYVILPAKKVKSVLKNHS